MILLVKIPLIKSLELIEVLLKLMIMKGNKYGRKYTTQTIITYENDRLVTKTIVHSEGQ